MNPHKVVESPNRACERIADDIPAGKGNKAIRKHRNEEKNNKNCNVVLLSNDDLVIGVL
ncbi:MAG: hypothetical protein AB1589_42720 [Cyanobacteriota bacterium]